MRRIDGDRWIDFSALPRSKSWDKIRWIEAIGYSMPFVYGEYKGTLRIVERVDERKYKIIINIGAEEIEYITNTSDLRNCHLGWALLKPIAVTHPELIQYFANKKDAYTYCAGSPAEVDMICPLCGTIKKKPVRELVKHGLACPACSDGVSYPNKFMYNLLQQLNVVFINELTKKYPGFEWVEKYRYDFYFNINGAQYIVEMDGGFHFNDVFCICSDDEKDKIAIQNGVEVIRINCDYHVSDRFDYVKSHIVNSKLSELFDLSVVDWDACDKNAEGSFLISACAYYTNGITDIGEISDKVGVKNSAIIRYLKAGTRLGLCNYDSKEARRKAQTKMKQIRSKPVKVFKNDLFVAEFPSRAEASRKSKEVLGVFFDTATISNMCLGKRGPRDGILFNEA